LLLLPTLVTFALTFLTRLKATFSELPAFEDWPPVSASASSAECGFVS
jgi:hypothetical protein